MPFVCRAGGNAGTGILEKKFSQKRGEWLWYFLSGLSLVLFVSLQAPAGPWAPLCPTRKRARRAELLGARGPGHKHLRPVLLCPSAAAQNEWLGLGLKGQAVCSG